MDNKETEYQRFFKVAMGKNDNPFPYQEKMALLPALPELLDIPTGCGKTAAVVLSWLWRRRFNSSTNNKTPRRLVYCLPMRVLVEQTTDNIKIWLKNLGMLAEKPGDEGPVDGWAKENGDDGDHRIAVTVLMGGEDKDEWDQNLDKDAIIIGTQDMLLSRALNRGYGMSRYRWPVHFGLLNNDCLWVMDEVQLMGVGVETSSQFQAFRKKLNASGNNHSIWMSATLDRNQLDTVDQNTLSEEWTKQSLSDIDRSQKTIRKRRDAVKHIKKASIELTKENSNKKGYPQELAEFILENHVNDTLSLVIVNNVERAQWIYQNLLENEDRNEENTAVLHSRFRQSDREQRMKLLGKKGDRVIVSTQVVEAGVDISARTLFTEIALWSSLVQRFGRCNRYGECDCHGGADIFWMDVQTEDEKGKTVDEFSLPYGITDIRTSKDILSKLEDAGPGTLSGVSYIPPTTVRPVIRRKDMIELFDTTPDLTGNDLDISRYIRDGTDSDVQVYWRDIPEGEPTPDFTRPGREELCSVTISEITKFLKKKGNSGWTWDHLDSRWEKVGKARPGQVILLDSENGGYTSTLGWIGMATKKPDPVKELPPQDGGTNESMAEDNDSKIGRWVTILKHCGAASNEVESLATSLHLPDEEISALKTAGLWHDVGKAHEAFQNMLQKGREDKAQLKENGPWAKSDGKGRATYFMIGEAGKKIPRKYFRHELASALSWLQTVGKEHPQGNLIAYLIAAHHGRVRQSIRSLPNENEPSNEKTLFARGVWQGDIVPKVPGITDDEIELDLSLMNMGEGSWLERTLRLRDEYGPFRLALLEAVLRVVDWKVSAAEKKGVGQ